MVQVYFVSYLDGCASVRNSLTYQQGEAVFLEASVESHMHPPLTLYIDTCTATLEPDPSSLPNYKFIANNGYFVFLHHSQLKVDRHSQLNDTV